MKKVRLSVLIIMLGTLISKVLGLLRDVILASSFGANIVSDAYLISTTIPSLIVGAIATAIMSTYIPVLNSALKESEHEAEEFNDCALSISLALVTMIVLIFFMIPDFVVSLFVVGFSNSDLDLVISMTKITIFMSYFLILISIFSSYLQNQNKFKSTSFNGIIFNTISILGIILSAKYNVLIMAYTFVIGYAIATVHLFYQAYKSGFRLKFRFDLKNKYIKKLVVLTIPVILNSVVWDINVMIDKTLTSTIGPGYVSALNYSYKIINVSTDMIAVSIATFIFPKISKLYHSKGEEELKSVLSGALNLVTVLIVPISMAIIIYSNQIVKILFMRGNFNDFALDITSNSLKLYSLLLLTSAINTIIYKYYNAIELNRIPAMNAVYSIISNIVLNFIFIKPLGYKGVILATVISTLLATLMILNKLRKKIGKHFFKTLGMNLIRTVICTIISAMISYLIFDADLFVTNDFFKLMVAMFVYLFIYVVSMMITKFKIKDVLI